MTSSTHKHQQELVLGFAKELRQVFEKSEQAIYIYLDDLNKTCNKNFARLLGYSSPEEWSGVENPFPQAFVTKKSRETLVNAYQDAMNKMIGSKVDITWNKKDGSEVTTSVILIPITYNNHLFALHFVSKT